MKSLNKIISRFISKYSPKLHFCLAYYHHRHKWPNLNKPTDLSELWIKRLLEGHINQYFYLADKFFVIILPLTCLFCFMVVLLSSSPSSIFIVNSISLSFLLKEIVLVVLLELLSSLY